MSQYDEQNSDAESPTPGAFQRRWRTPTEFPHCPPPGASDALSQYQEALTFGTVFGKNQYGESTVVTAKLGEKVLGVLTHSDNPIKEWAVAKVYLEDGRICHESVSSFFSLQGAIKVHCEIIGEEFGDSIDDYA